MKVFGYALAEWATLLGIITTLGGGILWIFNSSTIKPLKDLISTLQKAVDKLNANASYEHERFDDHLDKIDLKLVEYKVKIKTLNKAVFHEDHDDEDK